MTSSKTEAELQKRQAVIAQRVRALRKERQWTQAELAGQLGLSQSRLCEIEKGQGSFTAEQFLLILQLFNVPAASFAVETHQPKDKELQNALARLGASHLHESLDILPSEQLVQAMDVLRETLIAAESPRHVTALAAVLVHNIERINRRKLYSEFVVVGFERRLGWLLENTVTAIHAEAATTNERAWVQAFRRSEMILTMFLDRVQLKPESESATWEQLADVLDSDIRSKKSLDAVLASCSAISRRWCIATSLQPEDFIDALRASRQDA